MDINQLFGSQPSENESQTQVKQKTVSLVNYLNTKPLIYGLEQNLIKHDYILQKDVPSVCADRLLEGEVELGIIPSIEYARSKGAWKIVPELCIASQGAVKSVNLFFKKDLRDLRKIAVDTGSRTSVALLKILLRERYQMEPELLPMPPDLERMFQQADAALVIGDRALHYQHSHESYLDLGEEWFDLTGLPFVYAFWAGHELSINEEDVKLLQESYRFGERHLDDICTRFAADKDFPPSFYRAYLTENIHYQFGEAEKEGLKEFYNYAFYFGFIEHIPELHFYGEES